MRGAVVQGAGVRCLTVAGVMAGLMLSAVACAPPVRQAAPREAARAQPCASGQPRLPATGLCPDAAIRFLDPARVAELSGRRPDGCAWVAGDAPFSDPDSRGPRRLALIYMALTCNGQTTRLAVTQELHSAVITYAQAALQMETTLGAQTAQAFEVPEGEDPARFIEALARDTTLDAREAAACRIRPAGIDDYPADALVVDASQAWRADAGRAAGDPGFCGDYGVAPQSMAYWRIFDGFAWRFSFGLQFPQYDPASLILVAREGDGPWTGVSPP